MSGPTTLALALAATLGLAEASDDDFAGSPHFNNPAVERWARAVLRVREGVDGVPNDASMLTPHLAALTRFETNVWAQFSAWLVRFIDERGLPVTRRRHAMAAAGEPVPLELALRVSRLKKLAAQHPQWRQLLAEICACTSRRARDPYRHQLRDACVDVPARKAL